jgi:hypothetical protein
MSQFSVLGLSGIGGRRRWDGVPRGQGGRGGRATGVESVSSSEANSSVCTSVSVGCGLSAGMGSRTTIRPQVLELFQRLVVIALAGV